MTSLIRRSVDWLIDLILGLIALPFILLIGIPLGIGIMESFVQYYPGSFSLAKRYLYGPEWWHRRQRFRRMNHMRM